MEKTTLLNNKQLTDINPVDLGEEVCESGHSFGPCIRHYYLIHYVVKGTGVLYADKTEYKVNPGEIFVIRPEDITTYTADKENPWHYIWVGFSGNMGKYFDEANKRIFKVSGNLFNEMLKAEAYGNMRTEYVAGRIFELIASLFGGQKISSYTEMVKNYVDFNYMRDISVEMIADRIGIDRHYLSRLFKKECGMTIKQYIIDKRMKEAYKLLKSGFNVKQTSIMTGYSDPFVFSRAFKSFCGYSPVTLNK
ncbi:MAG: AraC family transcriptional regulator [Bacillota bacterium]|nr:AraC family transcriptional regulator [Bacillota bacterium]